MVISKPHAIHFTGSITQQTAHMLNNAFLEALGQNATEIKFLFSSEGGDLNAGLSFYNFLRAYPLPISVYNFASVESIAVLIYLAAGRRYILPGTSFLLHGFHASFPVATVANAQLVERGESLQYYADVYADIFNERTKGAQSPVKINDALRGKGIRISDLAAISAGIAMFKVEPGGLIVNTDAHWRVSP